MISKATTILLLLIASLTHAQQPPLTVFSPIGDASRNLGTGPGGRNALDTNFLMFGDKSVAPLAVYTDSKTTYVHLRDIRGSWPSLVAVTPVGYVPLRPRYDWPFVTFEGFEAEFVIVYPGERFVLVRHAEHETQTPSTGPELLFSETQNSSQRGIDQLLGKGRAQINNLRQIEKTQAQIGYDLAERSRQAQPGGATTQESSDRPTPPAPAQNTDAAGQKKPWYELNRASTPTKAGSGVELMSWEILASDGTLQKTLARWGRQAGWEVHWNNVPEINNPGYVKLVDGDFLSAAEDVLSKARVAALEAGFELSIVAHPNRVLVITKENKK